MKSRCLKLSLFSSLLLFFSVAVQAQDLHFIYIQTENQKPFYIKMDGQTIPSSPSGYIIIPRLTQGSYKSYIGFPKTELGELAVNFVVNDADAGYLLRNDLDQGLYMVNLLTQKFVPTERLWPVVKKRNVVKSNDAFAKMLSEVMNDSSINEIELFNKQAETLVKAEAVKTAINAVAEQSQAVRTSTPEIKTGSKTVISKLKQKNAVDGLSATYTDNADTVDIIIPVNKKPLQAIKEEKSKSLVVASDVSTKVKLKDSIAVVKTNVVLKNANCKRVVTQTEFLNIRKKMTAEKTQAAMRSVAGKQFGNACYTTEQVKNLGVLFISEEERYKFYVTVYPKVSDAENFAALESQLADNYYISRFKAMLNH